MPEDEAGSVTARDVKIDAFAAALAAGHSIEAAGQTVGISAATSYRWAGNPDVVESVHRYRSDIRRQVVDTLATGSTLAVGTLIEVAAHGESEHARVRAATALLSAARDWIEIEQLAQQLATLERSLQQIQPRDVSIRERARLELVVTNDSD